METVTVFPNGAYYSSQTAGNEYVTNNWVSYWFAQKSNVYTKTESDAKYCKNGGSQILTLQVYGGYLEIFNNGSYQGRVQLTV